MVQSSDARKKKPKCLPWRLIIKDPDLFSLAWRWQRGDLIIVYKNLHREKNHMFQKQRQTRAEKQANFWVQNSCSC